MREGQEIRVLDLADIMEEAETQKCYRVRLRDGRWKYVPKKGVKDWVPKGVVVFRWCFDLMMKKRRAA
jgi:hypothetical protein